VPTRESAFSPIAKKAAKGNRKFYGGKDSRLLRRPGVAEMTSRELLKELLKAPGREPQPVHPAADAQAADGAAGPNREGDGPLDRERFEIDWGHFGALQALCFRSGGLPSKRLKKATAKGNITQRQILWPIVEHLVVR